MKSIYVLLTACLLLGGCAPFKVEIGRHTEGRIVSREKHESIARAQVMYKGHVSTAVVTNAQGRFVLEAVTVTKWLPLLPVDYFGWRWHPLEIRADGFQTRTFEQAQEPSPTPVLIELTRLK